MVCVINIVLINGIINLGMLFYVYLVSKLGVVYLIKYLVIDFVCYKINVNGIVFGFFLSEMIKEVINLDVICEFVIK